MNQTPVANSIPNSVIVSARIGGTCTDPIQSHLRKFPPIVHSSQLPNIPSKQDYLSANLMNKVNKFGRNCTSGAVHVTYGRDAWFSDFTGTSQFHTGSDETLKLLKSSTLVNLFAF